jgi:hypothetical protein
MADYSRANKDIKHVLKLSAYSFPSEYYDWEDDMEKFLWGRGLNSAMQLFYAKKTFSEVLLSWWREIHKGHMMRGEEPCRTWDDMKAVLQWRFGIGPKPIVRLSRSIDVIGDTYRLTSYGKGTGINHNEKRLGSGARYSKLVHTETSSSSKTYKKNVADPYKFEMKCVAIKATTKDVRMVDSSKKEGSQLLLPKVAVPKPTVVHEHADFSLASGLHSCASFCDAQSELRLDIDDASDGLSMMAKEIHIDGTVASVKGQRSNIFQSDCKIQDKVCKLIIDGGSFANVISSDLVNALSLSTRRLPTPRYIQWMNQSGTLKITHKARVKFSVGTYIDTVDCDVAPLSACHLLLGRPWQFDLDATHGGRSNNYSFVHKGVTHVLKPMPENAIKAEVLATVKVTKTAAASTPKPRTALLQEGENGVAISKISSDVGEVAEMVNSMGKDSESHCKESENAKTDANKSSVQFDVLSNIVKHDKIHEFSVELNESSSNISETTTVFLQAGKEGVAITSVTDPNILVGGLMKPDVKQSSSNAFDLTHDQQVMVVTKEKGLSMNTMSKPRTALFQGREDDELMAPRIILACDTSLVPKFIRARDGISYSTMQFGGFSIDMKQTKMAQGGELDATLALSSRIFVGNNLRQKYGKKFVQIGSMLCEIKSDTKPGPTYFSPT